MDQMIGERETERAVIAQIKANDDISIRRKESDDSVVVVCQEDNMNQLQLLSRVVAMRRNPKMRRAKHTLTMADIERVETKLICAEGAQKECCTKESMQRLMAGALAYQNQMKVPFCLTQIKDTECFGFEYIYDRPHYELNTQKISDDMLKRAAAGECVPLSEPNTVLQAVSQEEMLSLAHFVNARLCRSYGLFAIRTAAYYEHIQEEMRSSGGNLFEIMENGMRKGYFAHTNQAKDSIREVVFDAEADREQYLLMCKEKKPAFRARIVNMPEMLRHISGNGKTTIAIRIQDPMIVENDGLFLWYIDGDGSRMERIEQLDDDKDPSMRPEVTVTIGEFTAFIFGYIKLKQNIKFDSIYLAGPAKINEIYEE